MLAARHVRRVGGEPALEDSGEAFRPEEVTETGRCVRRLCRQHEGPGATAAAALATCGPQESLWRISSPATARGLRARRAERRRPPRAHAGLWGLSMSIFSGSAGAPLWSIIGLPGEGVGGGRSLPLSDT